MKILAFAYACEPGKGSEPGAGWGFARKLTEFGEVCVITRANNRASIQAALPSIPEGDRLRFEYLDLPTWARCWKRGQRGVRLYYLLWLIAALRLARRLHAEQRFDLVWHLTLANAWLGTTAPMVGPKFVYGPVGGGVTVPLHLLPALGLQGILYEILRCLAQLVGRYLNPLARIAWRKADLILVQNPQTQRWLPSRYRHKAQVFPNALAIRLDSLEPRQAPPHTHNHVAVYAGRLIPWKGVSLALRALAELPDWRLVILGSGPDSPRLRRLATRYGLADRVEFRGWHPRNEVMRIMKEEATVLLFPSLHDDSPLVVAEALALGLTVVCLDHGGPPEVALAMGAQRQVATDWNTLVQALQRVSHLSALAFVPGHCPSQLSSDRPFRSIVNKVLPI